MNSSKEEWCWLFGIIEILLAGTLAFVAEALMFKVLLVGAIVAIAFFFAQTFYRIGFDRGELHARFQREKEVKEADKDVWLISKHDRAFGGHEVLVLRRDPTLSPQGSSYFLSHKHRRVCVTPCD